jgi:hypothetical protein
MNQTRDMMATKGAKTDVKLFEGGEEEIKRAEIKQVTT